MQEILNDIQSAAKRCMDTAKAMQDALEAEHMAHIVGLVEVLFSSSSMRSLPRRSSTNSVKPMAQSNKNQFLNETKSKAAPSAPSIGLSSPIRQIITPSVSNLSTPKSAIVGTTKNARTTPGVNRSAIDALRNALANAEHPAIRAAYEANHIAEHVEISILPKVGVLVEEYHDNAAEVHQKVIAKLVAKRDEFDRFLKKNICKLFLSKNSHNSGISPEDKSAFLDIFLGRGRESALGFYLAVKVLPELGAELSKLANRIRAKISLQAAKSEVISARVSPAEHTDGEAPKERISVKTNKEQAVDFIILTAIDVERRAVCKAFGLTEKDRVRIGIRVYWKGTVALKNGESYTIVVAQATDVANPDAALLTAEMIREWSPGAALLVGIAATSDPNKASLGDIVVGTDVYYYERHKQTPKGARPEPKSIPADPTLLNNIRSIDWSNEVPISRPDASNTIPRVHFGVIACGEKVIADAKKRNGLAKANRKILAIEMEGYGFSLAACQSFEKVRHLDIRGVCDDASDSKDDAWHEYAAAAAATLARDFLLDRPLEPRGKPAPVSSEASLHEHGI